MEIAVIQNRLDSTISNLKNSSENLSAANGRLVDADNAKETAEMGHGIQPAGKLNWGMDIRSIRIM